MAISWTALAMTLFPAAIGAREKASHLQLVVPPLPPIDGGPATDDGSDQKPLARAPTAYSVPARDFEITKADAVAEFVAVWINEVAGGGPQRFRTVAMGYADLAKGAGWPAISDKALSTVLQEWGCVTAVGVRQKDGSRPTIVTFPNEIAHRPRRGRLKRKRRQ
jgi:hypothetical protein